MKKMLLTVLVLAGLSAAALAQGGTTMRLRPGQQKTAGRGEIYVKLISVDEDSRCPPKAMCVWVGNAKVKVKIGFKGGDSKIVYMNTNMGPKGEQIGGWAINLTDLTPVQRVDDKKAQRRYIATFEVSRLTR